MWQAHRRIDGCQERTNRPAGAVTALFIIVLLLSNSQFYQLYLTIPEIFIAF